MANLKVSYVGTGGNAQGHLRRLSSMEGVEIAACCDVIEERAQASAEKYGGKAFVNWRRMLDSVETDACYFSLPPFAHEGAETEAASRGIHIFVEKPVCMDMETGLATKAALDKSGALSCVGYQTRYNRFLNAVREFVKDKTIGMAVTERWGGIAGGPTHWWRVMDKSGGMLHEQATHQLDMLRFCAGDISEVYALHALRINNEQENHDIPDAEVVTLQFAGGAVGYITTTSALIKGGGGSRVELIVEGHLRVQYSGNSSRILPENAGPLPEYEEPLPASIDHAFIEAIRTGDQSIVKSDYTDGLKTCAVTIAALESAASGKPVPVHPVD